MRQPRAIASVWPFVEFVGCRRSEPIVSKRSVISTYVRQALAGTRRFGEHREALAPANVSPEVSAILSAAPLPGADRFIAATAALGSNVGTTVARGRALVGLRPNADVAEVARGYASLVERDRRAAFLATLRRVIGHGGQRVAAGDRRYLTGGMPILIIWGERDPIVPSTTARERTRRSPAAGSRSSTGSATCRSSRRQVASSRCSSDSSPRTSGHGLTPSSGAGASATPAVNRSRASARAHAEGGARHRHGATPVRTDQARLEEGRIPPERHP